MRPALRVLRNTADIELWPAWLLRARSNDDARLLAGARRVLRRKRDGRFLAAETARGLVPMAPSLDLEPGIAGARRALREHDAHGRSGGVERVGMLALDGLQQRLDALGLDDGYATRSGLALVAEPAWLALAGFDRYCRPLWMHPEAARAWSRMQAAALDDDVVLEAISGYRSHAYQLGIFERKRARGQSVDEILQVNAAPGYSEHHGGRALDIGTPGEPPAEESFERTAAFAWLSRNAGAHGFTMSYPRGNPHGIVYEPWHWRHDGT